MPKLGQYVLNNVWLLVAACEPWTIYNTLTESCYHNPHMSTTGRLSLDIGGHAPCTTHQPTLATSSHTLLGTYWPSLGIVTYNTWPRPVVYEPWTIYNKLTESCSPNPHMSTAGWPMMILGGTHF